MRVKYVESEDEAYWILLRDVQEPNDPGQKTMTVRIPRANRLSRIDWTDVQAHVQTVTDRKLAAARAWQLQEARDNAARQKS